SYLHVNCAHCHQFGGGGSALVDFRALTPLDKCKAIGVTPVQGAFGLSDAKIVAPGDPYRSTLYYRMAKVGRGRMPHLGSEVVDDRGVRLMHEWIRGLPPDPEVWSLLVKLRALDETLAREQDQRAANSEIAEMRRRIARGKKRDEPTADDQREAEERYA